MKSVEQKLADDLANAVESHWFNPAIIGRLLANQPIYTTDRVMEMVAQIIRSISMKEDEAEGDEDTDEAEVEFEAEDKKDAGKKASALRPQPKRASTGAKVVGTQTRTASATEDMGDLARLWSSAPDVSKIFG